MPISPLLQYTKNNSNPTQFVNPTFKSATWINNVTGELFVCLDNTINMNYWVGQQGTDIIPLATGTIDIDTVDPFGDNSALGLYQLESNASDLGGNYPGVSSGVSYRSGLFGGAAYSSPISQIRLPYITFSGPVVTTTAWIKWNGLDGVMPFGFHRYDIYFKAGGFGFNAFEGAVYGLASASLAFTWTHVGFEWHHADVSNNKIYINGVIQNIDMYRGTSVNINNARIDSNFHVFGAGISTIYRDFGAVDQLRIFDRVLSPTEHSLISKESTY